MGRSKHIPEPASPPVVIPLVDLAPFPGATPDPTVEVYYRFEGERSTYSDFEAIKVAPKINDLHGPTRTVEIVTCEDGRLVGLFNTDGCQCHSRRSDLKQRYLKTPRRKRQWLM